MKHGIIGGADTAGRLCAALRDAGAAPRLLGSDWAAAGDCDHLLLAVEPWQLRETLSALAPHLKKGQTLLLGCGGAFATWTAAGELLRLRAPLGLVVGMCDAFTGHPEDRTLRVEAVQVSAHSFVYHQFLRYVAGDLFPEVRIAGSPLALAFRSPTLGWELAPLAEDAGLSQGPLSLRQEVLSLGERLGTERLPTALEPPASPFRDRETALRAAAVNLYPLVALARAAELPTPALCRLLEAADRSTGGRLSREGQAYCPNPALFFEH